MFAKSSIIILEKLKKIKKYSFFLIYPIKETKDQINQITGDLVLTLFWSQHQWIQKILTCMGLTFLANQTL